MPELLVNTMPSLSLPLAQSAYPEVSNWAPILLLLVIAVLFGVGNIVLSLNIGPSRKGKVKGGTYESGMVPVGDTRKGFNVRFYIVAMIFLVFDVEIILLYPFATVFPGLVQTDFALATMMLVTVLVFIVLLLDSYLYAWAKGVFRWD